jgi:hypothetical protein
VEIEEADSEEEISRDSMRAREKKRGMGSMSSQTRKRGRYFGR